LRSWVNKIVYCSTLNLNIPRIMKKKPNAARAVISGITSRGAAPNSISLLKAEFAQACGVILATFCNHWGIMKRGHHEPPRAAALKDTNTPMEAAPFLLLEYAYSGGSQGHQDGNGKHGCRVSAHVHVKKKESRDPEGRHLNKTPPKRAEILAGNNGMAGSSSGHQPFQGVVLFLAGDRLGCESKREEDKHGQVAGDENICRTDRLYFTDLLIDNSYLRLSCASAAGTGDNG